MSNETTTLTDRIDIDEFPIAATAVYALTVVLWLIVLQGRLPMGSGVGPPTSAPGVAEMLATSSGLFGVAAYLLTWGTTVLAITLPSMVPAVRRYRRTLRGPIHLTVLTLAAFVASYTLVWTLVGAVPLVADSLVSIHHLATTAGRPLIGGLLLLAGAYQMTPLKRALLAHCRAGHTVSHRPDPIEAIRNGFAHAAGCIGCTWALFALVVGLGTTSAFVVVGATLIVSLERLSTDGNEFALASGVVLLATGALTLAFGGPLVP